MFAAGRADMLKIGLGYDIHPIVPGNSLKLGGVRFPQAGFSLHGHSDADVLVHAACDALLGAAGLPDIGVLFPNTSARHRGRDSLEFLQVAGGRLARQGTLIVNLDCTLLAEAPKIARRVPDMRRQMAKALKISPEQISIKATTHEGLGCLGRREGIAALAVVLVEQKSKKNPKKI